MRIGSGNLRNSENSSLTGQSNNSLSDEAKTRAIMAIWLDYIRLEDLTNAKVDAQRHGVEYVWDKGVSLIGNHLMIDKTLFKTLKQEKKACANRNREEDYQIAVAFPSIAQFENNLRKFRPLFTIDLTPILSVNYRQKGWDLTEFEFYPVLPNLIKFYGIEEEEAELLPTREGLFVFLEAIFNRTFPTLQDFLNLIELPTKPLRSQPAPYLLRFGFASYNHHLKKDFQNLQGQLDYPWTISGHPAYEYLLGSPQLPNKDQLFLGAWGTSPPDEDQATALKHSCSHSLTAVIGPPGHGKFEQAEWSRAKERLLSAVGEFQSHREQAELEQKQRVLDEQQLEQNRAESEELTRAIEAIQSEQQPLSSNEEIDYSQFPSDTVERIAGAIELAWRTLPAKTRQPRSWYRKLGNWLLLLWRSFKRQTDGAIISRLNKSINEDVAHTKNTPFPLELIINRSHLEYWREKLAGQLTAAKEWRQRWSNWQRNSSQLQTLQQQIVSLKRQQRQIQQKIASYSDQDFHSCFYTELHQLQVQLFELSWQRAMFLGDPWQLEPIVSLSDSDKDLYRAKAFFARQLTDADYDCYSPTALSAYHRAAGGSGRVGDLGNGIVLKYHYRSVPEIAHFISQLCYPEMIIKTSPSPSRLGANLIACHVEGQQTDHINQAEIEVVKDLIKELLKAGYSLNSNDNSDPIGIISPYRRQADALNNSLRSRWSDFSSNSIGTVHTFQGGQKSVIILSTRQCHFSDSLWFINRRPNLLNVAVSRARELFILVGNLKLLREGEYSKLLIEYIEQFGEVRSF